MDVDKDFVVSRRVNMESIKSNKVFNVAVIGSLLSIVILTLSYLMDADFLWYVFWTDIIFTSVISLLCIVLKIIEYKKNGAGVRNFVNLISNVLAIVGFVILTDFITVNFYGLLTWSIIIEGIIAFVGAGVLALAGVLKLIYLIISKNNSNKDNRFLTSNKSLTLGTFFFISIVGFFGMYAFLPTNVFKETLAIILLTLFALLAFVFLVISMVTIIKKISAEYSDKSSRINNMSFMFLIMGVIAFELLFISIVSLLLLSIYSLIDRIMTVTFCVTPFISIAFFATALIFKIIELSKKRKVRVSE